MLVALAGANVAVEVVTRNAPARQLLATMQAAPPATDLFLGDSVTAAALDVPTFDHSHPGRRGMNLALGATKPVEHLLVYQRAAPNDGAVVYYGFFDTTLTDPVGATFSSLTGNRAIVYELDLQTATDLYGTGPLEAWRMRLAAQLPLVVQRAALWAIVERLRRQLGSLGMPPQKTNRFGRAEDFSQLEAADAQEFSRDCARAAAANAPFNPAVSAIVELARARKQRVVFVLMPMPSRHRSIYYGTPGWATYQEHLRRLTRQAGADWLDASDWIGDSDFADNLHMSHRGAVIFSQRIGGG